MKLHGGDVLLILSVDVIKLMLSVPFFNFDSCSYEVLKFFVIYADQYANTFSFSVLKN